MRRKPMVFCLVVVFVALAFGVGLVFAENYYFGSNYRYGSNYVPFLIPTATPYPSSSGSAAPTAVPFSTDVPVVTPTPVTSSTSTVVGLFFSVGIPLFCFMSIVIILIVKLREGEMTVNVVLVVVALFVAGVLVPGAVGFHG